MNSKLWLNYLNKRRRPLFNKEPRYRLRKSTCQYCPSFGRRSATAQSGFRFPPRLFCQTRKERKKFRQTAAVPIGGNDRFLDVERGLATS